MVDVLNREQVRDLTHNVRQPRPDSEKGRVLGGREAAPTALDVLRPDTCVLANPGEAHQARRQSGRRYGDKFTQETQKGSRAIAGGRAHRSAGVALGRLCLRNARAIRAGRSQTSLSVVLLLAADGPIRWAAQQDDYSAGRSDGHSGYQECRGEPGTIHQQAAAEGAGRKRDLEDSYN